METNFDKPVGTEIKTLNDKFTFSNITLNMTSPYTFNTGNGGCVTNGFVTIINGYVGKINTPITTNTKIGNVPSGARPAKQAVFTVPIANSNGYANIAIDTNGDISVDYMSTGGNIVMRGVTLWK